MQQWAALWFVTQPVPSSPIGMLLSPWSCFCIGSIPGKDAAHIDPPQLCQGQSFRSVSHAYTTSHAHAPFMTRPCVCELGMASGLLDLLLHPVGKAHSNGSSTRVRRVQQNSCACSRSPCYASIWLEASAQGESASRQLLPQRPMLLSCRVPVHCHALSPQLVGPAALLLAAVGGTRVQARVALRTENKRGRVLFNRRPQAITLACSIGGALRCVTNSALPSVDT